MDQDDRPAADEPRARPPAPRPAPDRAGAPAGVASRMASLGGRGLLAAAVVVAATVAAVALGALAGALTLLGWGLVVVVATAGVAIAAVLRGGGSRPWLLLPLVALAVPAVAVAASGVRVKPQRGPLVVRPVAPSDLPADGYRAGFGELLVDLRGFRAPAGRTITIRAGSDLERTVVALPRDRCFALDVRWRTGDLRLPRVDGRPRVSGLDWDGRALAEWAARDRSTRTSAPLQVGRIALFGRVRREARGRWVAPAPATARDAPTLRIDLRSEGGSFVVRDYPNAIGPLGDPGWPRSVTPPPSPGELRSDWQRPVVGAASVTRGLRTVPAPIPSGVAGSGTGTSATRATEPGGAGATSGVGPGTPTTVATTPTTPASPTTTAPTTTALAPVPRSARRSAATRRTQLERRARTVRRRAAAARRAGRAGTGQQRREMAREWARYGRQHEAFRKHWTALMNGACAPKGVLR